MSKEPLSSCSPSREKERHVTPLEWAVSNRRTHLPVRTSQACCGRGEGGRRQRGEWVSRSVSMCEVSRVFELVSSESEWKWVEGTKEFVRSHFPVLYVKTKEDQQQNQQSASTKQKTILQKKRMIYTDMYKLFFIENHTEIAVRRREQAQNVHST